MNEYIVTCDEETAAWVGNDVESMKKVVRCRDCKYCCEFAPDMFDCEWWGAEKQVIDDIDGFCAWASRREGAES